MAVDWNLPEDSCEKLSIKKFFLYAKGLLSRAEERKIDAHCGGCDDCRANLAYVFEIVNGTEKLSTVDQTLLLKYLHDPIYKHTIEKVKDSIREELLAEVKILMADNTSFEQNDTRKINAETIIENKILSDNDKVKNKFFSFSKILNKIPDQIISSNLSYFTFALLVVVFISLSIFSYLALSSRSNQQPSISKFSGSESSPIIRAMTQQVKQGNNTLYKKLDSLIDQYLESKHIDYLNEAELVAKIIDSRYGDKYGIGLVSYYSAAPSSALPILELHRKEMFSLLNQANGDNYKQRLDDSLVLEKKLYELGNLPEAYRVKFLIAKLYAKTYKYQECNAVIAEGISFSEKNQYLMLQGYFLLWKAKNTSLTANFLETEETFRTVINIGKTLEINELVVNPAMTLTGLYQMRDEDQKALEMAQSVFNTANYPDTNLELIIGLKQMAGLAAFKLGFSELANSYLHDAIELSEKSKTPYLIASSYTFLGLTLAEGKNFPESQEAYLKAKESLSQIQEEATRLDALSIVLGYQAKAKLSEGEFQEAANLYHQTLDINNRLGDKNNIENSQLNEGLAIALEKTQSNKESQEYFALASHYKALALSKHEQSNCLLSYLPSACYLGK
jgi:tetratricopeptide (TPR) repeat protein